MKKILTLSIILSLLSLSFLPVIAETYTTQPKLGTDAISLSIGQTSNFGGVDWLKITLLGLPGNHPDETCDDPNECELFNNSAKLEIQIRTNSRDLVIKEGAREFFEDGEIVIDFLSHNNNQGNFNVTIQDDASPIITPVIDNSSPVEVVELEQETTPSLPNPILESDISEPISYQIIKPVLNSKDVILIAEEEISIKEINEGGEVTKIAPKSGVKQVILIESGSEKLPSKELNDTTEPISGQDKREVLVGVSEGEVSIEVIKGVTKEDCEAYKEKCEETGNQIVCLKWGDICETPDYDSNQCSEIISLCNEGDEGACKKYSIACKIISSATTKEVLNIKENKIFMNEKEIKVMPDTASESAIEKLSLNKDVEIELKDTGKPVYEVVGSQEKRILGLFKTAVKVTTTLSAETGEIEKTKKPWWSFLAW